MTARELSQSLLEYGDMIVVINDGHGYFSDLNFMTGSLVAVREGGSCYEEPYPNDARERIPVLCL